MSTLFLTQDVSSVNLSNGGLEIERSTPDGPASMRLLLAEIDRIAVVGRPPVTLPALLSLLDAGIPCFFVTSHGRWRGALHSDEDRNAARRIRQYGRAGDRKFSLGVARPLVAAKIGNQLSVLRRFGRNRPERRGWFHRTPSLENLRGKALRASSLDSLRGTEGIASKIYFDALAGAFPPAMPFDGRNRRPPRDAANSLLSFSYALLLGEMEGVIRAHGLDPAIGNLHEDKTRTPSLPLDLMEPFRPACDRFVVKLASLGVMRAGTSKAATTGASCSTPRGAALFSPPGRKSLSGASPGRADRRRRSAAKSAAP